MATGSEEVLLVTTNPMLVAAVDGALSTNGRVWRRTAVQTLRELMLHLSRSSGSACLVDLDPKPVEMLAELEQLTARFPGTRFVALSNLLDQDLLLAAMQSGVRHVLLKQKVGSDLVSLLHRMGATGAAATMAVEQGDVIVVLSAGGGCGATTLAVNVADELGIRAGKPALLIDLDFAYGTLATVLGLEPKYGIDHVLSHGGMIDEHLVRSATTPYNDNLHLLASVAGDGFPTAERLDVSRLQQVLYSAMTAYRYVVIDAPRVPAEAAVTLATASTRTLLAMQLTVKDARVARAMIATLTSKGVPQETVVPVVQRYAKRQHVVGLEDVSRALGGVKIECVRNDYPSAAKAMDFGQTLSVAAPRSAVRKDVQELVGKVVVAGRRQ